MLASSAYLRAQPALGRPVRRPAARRAALVTRSSLLSELAVQVRRAASPTALLAGKQAHCA